MSETRTMSDYEAAFYVGAVWGHREGRQNDGPLKGADILDEFRRRYPQLALRSSPPEGPPE